RHTRFSRDWSSDVCSSDLDTMVHARMQNTGQSCIAAKRFIVVEDIYNEFLEKFKAKVKSLNIGDPADKNTDLSVLAREDLAKTLKKQVDTSISQGAKVRSEEHTSELQSRENLVCRLLLEKKKQT